VSANRLAVSRPSRSPLVFGLMFIGSMFLSTPAIANETLLVKAADLRADAAAARKQGLPILILASLRGCPHCETIRRSHLAPMNAENPPKAIIRQIDLGSVMTLKSFSGETISHAAFLNQQGIKFAPVVMFFGPDGKRIGEPLIGTMLPDFYSAYLNDALVAATALIVGTKSEVRSNQR
jgi:thioredoxin-related protein